MIKRVADPRRFICLIVILILGSLSSSWFRGEYLIAGGDYFFDLEPNLSLQKALYSWSLHGLGGLPQAHPTILFLIILVLFQAIGLAPTLAQKIIVYFLFTGSGLSMYILTSVVTVKKDNITPLFSALFYMLNFWSLVHIWTVPYTFSLHFVFAYSFLPLILGLLIKGLKERNVRFILASAFATLLSSPSFTNPVVFGIVLGLPALYTVYHVIAERGGSASMKRFALFTFASLSFNAFWILPLLPLVGSFLSSQYRMYGPDLDVFRSQSLPILETIRMTGYWTLRTEVFSDPIIPWSPIFSSSLFVVLSFLMPVLSFVAILLRRKNKHVVFFTLVAVITIFLMKGSAPPFGDLTEKVFMTIGLISVFRVPSHKFGIYLTLCFSFLTAFVLRSAISSIKKNQQGNMLYKARHWLRSILRTSPVAIIIFALVGAYVWPFWTGDVIRSKGDIIPSARIKVPDYYHYANEWLSSQSEDFNILSLPLQSSSSQAAYLWSNGSEGYFGVEPGLVIFTKPLIFTVHDGNGIIGSVIELLSRGTTYKIGKVLQLFDVKYILVHDDLQLDLAKAFTIPDPKLIPALLDSTGELELEKTFGNLRFYRNSEWKPRSHIYASSNVLFTHGITEILPVVSSDRFVLGDSVLFLQIQLTHEQITIVEKYPSARARITITYEKANPTNYIVHANASEPLFLIFNESYHKDWVAYINGQQIPNEYHFMANGYANAWYINKTGTYTITLEFWPQKLFYIGSTISITTLTISILYITKEKIKTLYHYLKKKKRSQTSKIILPRAEPNNINLREKHP